MVKGKTSMHSSPYEEREESQCAVQYDTTIPFA